MHRRNIFTLSTGTALALALLPNTIVAQQGTLKQQLVGTWTLISYEDINSDGTRKQYQGAGPRGILVLDAGGRYVWVEAPSGRPKLKGSRVEATAEEFHAAVGTFVANFGTWSVNEADKTLIRQVEGALIPNAEGKEAGADNTCIPARPVGSCRDIVSLAGDELKITQPSVVSVLNQTITVTEHQAAVTEIVFRRAK
jgi:hypothetical protein